MTVIRNAFYALLMAVASVISVIVFGALARALF